MKKILTISFLIFTILASFFNINYANSITTSNITSTNTNTLTTRYLKNVLIIPPTQNSYKVGEKLNLDGLKITAIYNNNEVKEITKGYTVTGYNKNKEGIQTVKISYKGFSTTYDVKVGNSSTKIDLNNTEKLPQTGDFFDLKDGLYLLICILSVFLIFIIYKSTKRNEIQK